MRQTPEAFDRHIRDLPRIQMYRQPPRGLAGLPSFVATTAFAIWLAIEPCQGQSHDIAFGVIRRIRMSEQFERASFLAGPKDQNVLLWTPGQLRFLISPLDSVRRSLSTRFMHSRVRFDEVVVADIDNSGTSDLLLLDVKEQTIHAVLSLPADTLRVNYSTHLEFEPSAIIIGDLNGDRRQDFIAIDTRNPGIVSFLGDGRGGFKRGKAIAPDNAISHAVFTHLNNDRLVDLVTYDWVKSELHLLYGVGRGRFLNQSVFPVEGELQRLLVLEKGVHGSVDFVLLMKKPLEIQYWEGNGLGDFHKKVSVPLSDEVVDIALEDINNNGFKDLIILTRRSLEVYFNSTEAAFADKVDYACPPSSRLHVADLNRDGRAEVVLMGKDGQLVVYLNGSEPHVLRDSLEFVTGVMPGSVWVGSVDVNKQPYVVVVNEQSRTFSHFATLKRGGILGQSSYLLSPNPRYVSYHSSTDTTIRFLVSYPESKSISFFSLNLLDHSSVNAAIPTDGESEVLFTSATRGKIEFFCSNAASQTQDASLSYYLRINPQTFLERSYRLASPNTLLGVALGDIDRDSNIDLVYVYRSTESSNLEVGVALLDTALGVKERMIAQTLPGFNDNKCYLWTANLDADDTLDTIISFPKESKKIFVLKGASNEEFSKPEQIAEEVVLTDRMQLNIADVDADNQPDLVIHNAVTNIVGWLKNDGNMSFSSWQSLIQAESGSHFALGDVNGDGIPDVAVTYPQSGSLKIFSGTLYWKHHEARKATR